MFPVRDDVLEFDPAYFDLQENVGRLIIDGVEDSENYYDSEFSYIHTLQFLIDPTVS